MDGRHEIAVRAKPSGTRQSPTTLSFAVCLRCGTRYALGSDDRDLAETEARFNEVFPSCDEELVRKVMES